LQNFIFKLLNLYNRTKCNSDKKKLKNFKIIS